MFEITYKDKERLNEYIENRKAYPNAVYDFTFENRFLVYHCEMTNELHYIALDMETGCGSEMCRRKKNSPIPAESFNSLIPSIFQSIKYTGSVRHLNPMDVDPIELIDSIFRVVLPKYGYAVREEQIRLAKQMFKGLTNDLVSINEAEVGTGKTLAFLVAALVASKTNRDGISKPITITTANIELQTALVEKEIPKLSQCLMDYNIISRPLTAVLRKGREHYFCKKRFKDFLTTIKRTPEKYGNLIETFEKLDFENRAFDLDRYKIRPSLKDRICVNAKMMKLINDAVSEGRSIDDNEGEFKEISDEIAQLNSRVSAIKELIANDESAKDRLESINAKVEELKDGITEYDDTIVRQMIECIKVYGDKRIEVIFGGGTSIIEEL